jgi:HEPN domain-containing protein
MTPAVEEAHRLLRMAQGDRDAFLVLKNASGIRSSIVCFHAQQAPEKALKAALTAKGVAFRRMHDLDQLGRLLIANNIIPPHTPEELAVLHPYAALLRYDEIETGALGHDEAERMVHSVLAWAAELLRKL